jgi:hypothetical protein
VPWYIGQSAGAAAGAVGDGDGVLDGPLADDPGAADAGGVPLGAALDVDGPLPPLLVQPASRTAHSSAGLSRRERIRQ